MADYDRWRNDPRQHGYRDDDYDSYREEGYRRGGREGDYRGGGFPGTFHGHRGGRGTEGRGDIRSAGGAYGNDERGMTGPRGERDYRGGYGSERYRGAYQDRDYGGGYGAERYRRAYRDRDYGGGYGAERYGESYQDYARGNYERGYGGNDYARGFYGADQGYRGPGQDERGYRGERSGWDRFSDEVSSWFGDDEAARRREQDARQGDWEAQYHRGRGPKGYTRSDERIREDVSDRLTDDPMVDASEIEVRVSSCEVTLSGTVESREAKRRAEDCAERVSGVTHVQNNLRVQQQSYRQDATTRTAGIMSSGSASGPQGTGLGGVEIGPKGSEASPTDRTGPRKAEANT